MGMGWGTGMGTDVTGMGWRRRQMGQGLGGDWDRCDGDGEKLVGLGWVWGEQVVPVQLSMLMPRK